MRVPSMQCKLQSRNVRKKQIWLVKPRGGVPAKSVHQAGRVERDPEGSCWQLFRGAPSMAVESQLEGSCWQLLRGASSMAIESQHVRERPFGLSAEGVASNAPRVPGMGLN